VLIKRHGGLQQPGGDYAKRVAQLPKRLCGAINNTRVSILGYMLVICSQEQEQENHLQTKEKLEALQNQYSKRTCMQRNHTVFCNKNSQIAPSKAHKRVLVVHRSVCSHLPVAKKCPITIAFFALFGFSFHNNKKHSHTIALYLGSLCSRRANGLKQSNHKVAFYLW